MEKTYTFKQVIFALREEYVEAEKQLAALKKFINVSKKIGFDFLIQDYNITTELYLNLYYKISLLDRIRMLLGTYVYGGIYYNVTNGVYSGDLKEKNTLLTITNLEELNKKIEEIINSDFFNNMSINPGKKHAGIRSNESENDSLSITANDMNIWSNSKGYPLSIRYSSYNDRIEFYDAYKGTTPNDIIRWLNLSINSNHLNDYHHRIIDNYEEKEIEIRDWGDSDTIELEIVEEPKKLILVPKN